MSQRALPFERLPCVALDAFTLHAATRAGGHDAAGTEALLKYVVRPRSRRSESRGTAGPDHAQGALLGRVTGALGAGEYALASTVSTASESVEVRKLGNPGGAAAEPVLGRIFRARPALPQFVPDASSPLGFMPSLAILKLVAAGYFLGGGREGAGDVYVLFPEDLPLEHPNAHASNGRDAGAASSESPFCRSSRRFTGTHPLPPPSCTHMTLVGSRTSDALLWRFVHTSVDAICAAMALHLELGLCDGFEPMRVADVILCRRLQ
jgi:hypothetical protein